MATTTPQKHKDNRHDHQKEARAATSNNNGCHHHRWRGQPSFGGDNGTTTTDNSVSPFSNDVFSVSVSFPFLFIKILKFYKHKPRYKHPPPFRLLWRLPLLPLVVVAVALASFVVGACTCSLQWRLPLPSFVGGGGNQ